MTFLGDTGICSESSEQLADSLERWRYTLERKAMKVNESKMSYVCLTGVTVALQFDEFKYHPKQQMCGVCGDECQG